MTLTTNLPPTLLRGIKRKELDCNVVELKQIPQEPCTSDSLSEHIAKRARISTEPETEHIIKADKPVLQGKTLAPKRRYPPGKRAVQYDTGNKASREILGLADELEDDPDYVAPISNEAIFEEEIDANPEKWERDDEQEVVYVTKSLKARDGNLFLPERRPLNTRLCKASANRLNFNPEIQLESWDADPSTYRNPLPEGLYMSNKEYEAVVKDMIANEITPDEAFYFEDHMQKGMKRRGPGPNLAGKKQENYLPINTMSCNNPNNDKDFGAKVIQAAVNMGYISSRQDFIRQLADVQEMKETARRARENRTMGFLAMAHNPLLHPDAAGLGRDDTKVRMAAAERRKKQRKYAHTQPDEYTKTLNAAKHVADIQEYQGKIGKSSSSKYARGGRRSRHRHKAGK